MASLKSPNHHAFPRSLTGNLKLPLLVRPHLSSPRSATDSLKLLPQSPAHLSSLRSPTDSPKPPLLSPPLAPLSLRSLMDSPKLLPPWPPLAPLSLRSLMDSPKLLPPWPPLASLSLRSLMDSLRLLGLLATSLPTPPALPPRSSLALPPTTPLSVAWWLVSLPSSPCSKHFLTSYSVISALSCIVIARAETNRSHVMDGKQGGSLYDTL
jgi:hypothetical protein